MNMNLFELEDEKGVLHKDQPPDSTAKKIFNFINQEYYPEVIYLTILQDQTYLGTAHTDRSIIYLYAKIDTFYYLVKPKDEKCAQGFQPITRNPNTKLMYL